MAEYTRLDVKMLAVQTFFSIKDVFEGNRDGNFAEESLRAIEEFIASFDLDSFLKEADSYGWGELDQVHRTCMGWLAALEIEPVKSERELYNPIKPYFEQATGEKEFPGHLIVDVGEGDIIPEDDKEDNYWLLTDDGYLEFHGGGFLRNSHGEIMSAYNGTKAIGKKPIEGGLDTILNQGMAEDEKIDRNKVIDLMLEAGLNYRTTNSDDISDRESWYWDLKENLVDNEVRRVKLPESVVEYYKQFEPHWEKSWGLGVDNTGKTNGKIKYHLGVDWVFRYNNRDHTIHTPVISTTNGKIEEINRDDPDNEAGLGLFVRVECSDSSRIDYFHLNKVSSGLKVGDPVTAGLTILGEAGDTGLGEAHLHIAKSYTDYRTAKDEGFSEEKIRHREWKGMNTLNVQRRMVVQEIPEPMSHHLSPYYRLGS